MTTNFGSHLKSNYNPKTPVQQSGDRVNFRDIVRQTPEHTATIASHRSTLKPSTEYRFSEQYRHWDYLLRQYEQDAVKLQQEHYKSTGELLDPYEIVKAAMYHTASKVKNPSDWNNNYFQLGTINNEKARQSLLGEVMEYGNITVLERSLSEKDQQKVYKEIDSFIGNSGEFSGTHAEWEQYRNSIEFLKQIPLNEWDAFKGVSSDDITPELVSQAIARELERAQAGEHNKYFELTPEMTSQMEAQGIDPSLINPQHAFGMQPYTEGIAPNNQWYQDKVDGGNVLSRINELAIKYPRESFMGGLQATWFDTAAGVYKLLERFIPAAEGSELKEKREQRIDYYSNKEENAKMWAKAEGKRQAVREEMYSNSPMLGLTTDVVFMGEDFGHLMIEMSTLGFVARGAGMAVKGTSAASKAGTVARKVPEYGKLAKGLESAYNGVMKSSSVPAIAKKFFNWTAKSAWAASRPQTIAHLSRTAFHRFMTNPGELEDKLEASGWAMLYNITPALANATGWHGLKAATADFVLNTLISIKSQYSEAFKRHGGMTSEFIYEIFPSIVMDIFMSRSTKGSQEMAVYKDYLTRNQGYFKMTPEQITERVNNVSKLQRFLDTNKVEFGEPADPAKIKMIMEGKMSELAGYMGKSVEEILPEHRQFLKDQVRERLGLDKIEDVKVERIINEILRPSTFAKTPEELEIEKQTGKKIIKPQGEVPVVDQNKLKLFPEGLGENRDVVTETPGKPVDINVSSAPRDAAQPTTGDVRGIPVSDSQKAIALNTRKADPLFNEAVKVVAETPGKEIDMFDRYGIILDDFLLRNIKLPASVEASIEDKQATEQRIATKRNEVLIAQKAIALNTGKADPLFNEAVKVVVNAENASISLLRKRLKINFRRASSLITDLVEAGVISPFKGDRPREVLLNKEQAKQIILETSGDNKPKTPVDYSSLKPLDSDGLLEKQKDKSSGSPLSNFINRMDNYKHIPKEELPLEPLRKQWVNIKKDLSTEERVLNKEKIKEIERTLGLEKSPEDMIAAERESLLKSIDDQVDKEKTESISKSTYEIIPEMLRENREKVLAVGKDYNDGKIKRHDAIDKLNSLLSHTEGIRNDTFIRYGDDVKKEDRNNTYYDKNYGKLNQDIINEIDRIKKEMTGSKPDATRATTGDVRGIPVSDSQKATILNAGKADPLFNEAVKVVVNTGNASISLLQKRLNIDFSRVSSLMTDLEEAGVISPFTGDKPRKVLLNKEQVKPDGEMKFQKEEPPRAKRAEPAKTGTPAKTTEETTFKIAKNSTDGVSGMRGDSGKAHMNNTKPGKIGWLGNPYVVEGVPGTGKRYPRSEAVALFEKDFLNKVKTDKEFRDAVLNLRGKTVAYFKPESQDSHIRVVQRWLAEQSGDTAKAIGKPEAEKTTALDKITFEESKTSEYRDRTEVNARADATIAIAVDFNSAGEKLTKFSVTKQGKIYIPVHVSSSLKITDALVNRVIKSLGDSKTLNVAGNGIYTMKGKYTQNQVDKFTYDLLKKVIEHPDTKIESIRSGGQTGFDEAGIKAGIKLGLPTIVLAPKGWVYRDETGKDISGNEKAFKERFGSKALESKTEPKTGIDKPGVERSVAPNKITKLNDNQVFVFGSNLRGFHGAGSAGYASFGRSGNVWREEDYGNKLNGWKGKWNVKGQGKGYQEGSEGKSYALPTKETVSKILPETKIIENIKKLYAYAKKNPDKEFMVAGATKLTDKTLSEYTGKQMADMFIKAGEIPDNVIFNKAMNDYIFKDSQSKNEPKTESKPEPAEPVKFVRAYDSKKESNPIVRTAYTGEIKTLRDDEILVTNVMDKNLEGYKESKGKKVFGLNISTGKLYDTSKGLKPFINRMMDIAITAKDEKLSPELYNSLKADWNKIKDSLSTSDKALHRKEINKMNELFKEEKNFTTLGKALNEIAEKEIIKLINYARANGTMRFIVEADKNPDESERLGVNAYQLRSIIRKIGKLPNNIIFNDTTARIINKTPGDDTTPEAFQRYVLGDDGRVYREYRPETHRDKGDLPKFYRGESPDLSMTGYYTNRMDSPPGGWVREAVEIIPSNVKIKPDPVEIRYGANELVNIENGKRPVKMFTDQGEVFKPYDEVFYNQRLWYIRSIKGDDVTLVPKKDIPTPGNPFIKLGAGVDDLIKRWENDNYGRATGHQKVSNVFIDPNTKEVKRYTERKYKLYKNPRNVIKSYEGKPYFGETTVKLSDLKRSPRLNIQKVKEVREYRELLENQIVPIMKRVWELKDRIDELKSSGGNPAKLKELQSEYYPLKEEFEKKWKDWGWGKKIEELRAIEAKVDSLIGPEPKAGEKVDAAKIAAYGEYTDTTGLPRGVIKAIIEARIEEVNKTIEKHDKLLNEEIYRFDRKGDEVDKAENLKDVLYHGPMEGIERAIDQTRAELESIINDKNTIRGVLEDFLGKQPTENELKQMVGFLNSDLYIVRNNGNTRDWVIGDMKVEKGAKKTGDPNNTLADSRIAERAGLLESFFTGGEMDRMDTLKLVTDFNEAVLGITGLDGVGRIRQGDLRVFLDKGSADAYISLLKSVEPGKAHQLEVDFRPGITSYVLLNNKGVYEYVTATKWTEGLIGEGGSELQRSKVRAVLTLSSEIERPISVFSIGGSKGSDDRPRDLSTAQAQRIERFESLAKTVKIPAENIIYFSYKETGEDVVWYSAATVNYGGKQLYMFNINSKSDPAVSFFHEIGEAAWSRLTPKEQDTALRELEKLLPPSLIVDLNRQSTRPESVPGIDQSKVEVVTAKGKTSESTGKFINKDIEKLNEEAYRANLKELLMEIAGETAMTERGKFLYTSLVGSDMESRGVGDLVYSSRIPGGNLAKIQNLIVPLINRYTSDGFNAQKDLFTDKETGTSLKTEKGKELKNPWVIDQKVPVTSRPELDKGIQKVSKYDMANPDTRGLMTKAEREQAVFQQRLTHHLGKMSFQTERLNEKQQRDINNVIDRTSDFISKHIDNPVVMQYANAKDKRGWIKAYIEDQGNRAPDTLLKNLNDIGQKPISQLNYKQVRLLADASEWATNAMVKAPTPYDKAQSKLRIIAERLSDSDGEANRLIQIALERKGLTVKDYKDGKLSFDQIENVYKEVLKEERKIRNAQLSRTFKGSLLKELKSRDMINSNRKLTDRLTFNEEKALSKKFNKTIHSLKFSDGIQSYEALIHSMGTKITAGEGFIQSIRSIAFDKNLNLADKSEVIAHRIQESVITPILKLDLSPASIAKYLADHGDVAGLAKHLDAIPSILPGGYIIRDKMHMATKSAEQMMFKYALHGFITKDKDGNTRNVNGIRKLFKGTTMRERVNVSYILEQWDNANKKKEILVTVTENNKSETIIRNVTDKELKIAADAKVIFQEFYKLANKAKLLGKKDRIENYFPHMREVVNGKRTDWLDTGDRMPSKFYTKERSGALEEVDRDAGKIMSIYLNSLSKNIYFAPVVKELEPLKNALTAKNEYGKVMFPNRAAMLESMLMGAMKKPNDATMKQVNTLIVPMNGMRKVLSDIGFKSFKPKTQEEALDIISNYSRWYIQAQVVRTMGASVSTVLRNLTQKNLSVWYVAKEGDRTRGFRYWAEYRAAMLDPKKRAEMMELSKYCTVLQGRTFEEGFKELNKLENELNTTYGTIGKGWEKTAEALMSGFKWADHDNVRAGFYLGVRAALDDGKSMSEAIVYGNKVAYSTQFDYGIGRPMIYHTPVGKTAALFHSWPMNYVTMLKTMHDEQGSQEFAKNLIGQTITFAVMAYVFRKLGLAIRVGPGETVMQHPAVKGARNIYAVATGEEADDATYPIFISTIRDITKAIEGRNAKVWTEVMYDFAMFTPARVLLQRTRPIYEGYFKYEDGGVRMGKEDPRYTLTKDFQGYWNAATIFMGMSRFSDDRWRISKGGYGESSDFNDLHNAYEIAVHQQLNPDFKTTTRLQVYELYKAAKGHGTDIENLFKSPEETEKALYKRLVAAGADADKIRKLAVENVRRYYFTLTENAISMGGRDWQQDAMEGLQMVKKTDGNMNSQKETYQKLLDTHPDVRVRERAFWILQQIEKYQW